VRVVSHYVGLSLCLIAFLRVYLHEVTGNPLSNLAYTLYRVVSLSLHTFQIWLRTNKYREQDSLRHTDDSAHIQGGSNMTGDWLCVNKSQFVPVIFEPPCSSLWIYLSEVLWRKILHEFNEQDFLLASFTILDLNKSNFCTLYSRKLFFEVRHINWAVRY
jgi:hypothetical protein